MTKSRRIRTACLVFGLVAVATAAFGQTPPPSVRVRGTVQSLDGQVLTVKSRDGDSVPITLKDGWTIGGIKAATLADIKPGTFVGTAALPRGDAPMAAIEVLVFPPGVKSGEGHYGWDLMPESTMTNATVASTVAGVSGPVITLTYPGGEKQVAITADTPLVTFAPADKADLKPGAPVFVSATRDGAGLTAARVTVGNNGIAPPM